MEFGKGVLFVMAIVAAASVYMKMTHFNEQDVLKEDIARVADLAMLVVCVARGEPCYLRHFPNYNALYEHGQLTFYHEGGMRVFDTEYLRELPARGAATRVSERDLHDLISYTGPAKWFDVQLINGRVATFRVGRESDSDPFQIYVEYEDVNLLIEESAP